MSLQEWKKKDKKGERRRIIMTLIISKVPKPKSWGREKRDKVLGWLHYASETVATL